MLKSRTLRTFTVSDARIGASMEYAYITEPAARAQEALARATPLVSPFLFILSGPTVPWVSWLFQHMKAERLPETKARKMHQQLPAGERAHPLNLVSPLSSPFFRLVFLIPARTSEESLLSSHGH